MKMKTLTMLLIASASLAIVAIVSFLMSSDYSDNQIISAITDKKIYHYGEKIDLQISETNLGPKKEILVFKNNYAGLPGPCGKAFFDFVFLKGDYSKIHNYDELVEVRNNAINVVYPFPFDAVSCPYSLRDYRQVTIDPYSNHATITFGDGSNPNKVDLDLFAVYRIDHEYSYLPVDKQTDQNRTEKYMENKLIPTGKYTVIAFNLAGKISKPNLIEIV